MIRKSLLTLAGALAIAAGAMGQTTPTYTLVEGYLFSYLSNDGKWAVENLSNGAGTNIYNVAEGKIETFENFLCNSVSPNGIIIGKSKDLAAIIDNGETKTLPHPDDELLISSTAWDITEDENMICGAITYTNIEEGGTIRKPCIWEKQDDGSYKLTMIDYPEKDYAHLTPQAIDAMFCSEDYIAGRVIDWTGYRNYGIVWKKDAEGIWQYEEMGLDAIYKEGVEIPEHMPVAPEDVNPMIYFTKNDSIKYNEDLEKYANGELTQNPAYYQRYYITNVDSLAAYGEAIDIYNEKFAEYQKELKDYNTALNNACTGDRFDMFSCRKCEGGDKIMVAYNFEVAPRERKTVPAYFNLKDGSITVERELRGLPTGLSYTGDLFYSTPVDNPTRTSYVLEKGAEQPQNFAEWVKEETDGVIDIEDDYRFTFTYFEDRVPVEAVDSLVTGTVIPSDKGNILMSFMQRPSDNVKTTYFINLGKKEITEHNAPVNLSMEPTYSNLHFTWQDPIGTSELGYCTKEHEEGEGLGNEGQPIIAAIQFTKSDLEKYTGQYINSLTFFVNQRYFEADRVETKMNLVVFENGNNKIVDQEIATLENNAWNTVALETPLLITGENSIQIGVEVKQHNVNEWPLGSELSLVNDGKANLYSIDGGNTWTTLTHHSKDMWCMYANVSENEGAGKAEDIAGYRFYCNGQLYQQELIKAQRISIPMPSTSDVFTVAAVYVDGVESEMSNEVSWSTSDIFELEEAPEVYVENRTLYVNSDYNSIKVYNISGMLEGEYYFGETSIDLSDLNSGVYVIVVENNNGTRTQKVILQ